MLEMTERGRARIETAMDALRAHVAELSPGAGMDHPAKLAWRVAGMARRAVAGTYSPLLKHRALVRSAEMLAEISDRETTHNLANILRQLVDVLALTAMEMENG